ncbi:hypothetical protein MRX96_016972 [Rhipicephalus microplus]
MAGARSLMGVMIPGAITTFFQAVDNAVGLYECGDFDVLRLLVAAAYQDQAGETECARTPRPRRVMEPSPADSVAAILATASATRISGSSPSLEERKTRGPLVVERESSDGRI